MMRNYNEPFFAFLQKVQDLDLPSYQDLPRDLQTEYEQLMFLSDFAFRMVFQDDPECMGDFLQICLPEEDYYDDTGVPLTVTKMEMDKVFESPVTGTVTQVLLYAEDNRNRKYVVQYCDHRGPEIRSLASVYDALKAEEEDADLTAIYITDYDVGRQGLLTYWFDMGEENAEVTNLHMVLFNAKHVATQAS